MKVIIDRFEGDYAIIELEDSSIIEVPKILFENFKEGNVIKLELDEENTNDREKEINNLMDALFQ